MKVVPPHISGDMASRLQAWRMSVSRDIWPAKKLNKPTFQAVLAFMLRLSGWLAVNALCALGCVAVVFIAIGSFTIEGTMLQLSNLTTRYVAADIDRQSSFNTILLVGSGLFFFAASFFRRASGARALEEIK
jgi:hypothetical protein